MISRSTAALISSDDGELAVQLGRQVQRLAAEKGFAPTDALDEVAEATKGALRGGRPLAKDELHDELRERVGADLLPWCKGCKSNHVAPMLWRYGAVKAGARLDPRRRYVLAEPGRAPAAAEALTRFLHFYGPSDVGDFAEWSGVARPHAKRLWSQVEGDLSEVSVGSRKAVGGLVDDPPLPAAQAARHGASPPERTFVTHPLALRRPRIAPPPRPRGRLAIVVMAERRVVTRDHAPAQPAEHPVEGLEHGIPQT